MSQSQIFNLFTNVITISLVPFYQTLNYLDVRNMHCIYALLNPASKA